MAFRDAFERFPTLSTERLTLRALTVEDSLAYFNQQTSARVLPDRPRWSFGGETSSVVAARKYIQLANSAWRNKSRLKWAICLNNDTGTLIGSIELCEFHNRSRAEVGFWLGAAYHRQGYMTEAATRVLDYGLGDMNLHRIQAFVSPTNAPALALCSKLGFITEGVLRQYTPRDGIWDDSVLLARLQSASPGAVRYIQSGQ